MAENETQETTPEVTEKSAETPVETQTAATEVVAEPAEAPVEKQAETTEATAETPAETTETVADSAAPKEEKGETKEADAKEEEVKVEEPVDPDLNEEISYHAVEKEGEITAIWEMQGRRHLRTISARSGEGEKILSLFTSEIHETDSPGISESTEATAQSKIEIEKRENIIRMVFSLFLV